MDEDIYDEFGNLLNEEQYDSDSDNHSGSFVSDSEVDHKSNNNGTMGDENVTDLTIRQPKLSEVYGPDVEVLVETQDRDDVNLPLVQPYDTKRRVYNAVFTQLKRNIPKAAYDREYMLQLASSSERCINICVCGPLHSGKTSLMDILAIESHERLPYLSKAMKDGWKPLKYTDNIKLEIERGLSMKLNGFTFIKQDSKAKSHVITVLDAPGHVNFLDETIITMAASDCCLIVIDVVEGINSIVVSLIKRAQREKLPVLFVLNKIDRLILELKLPPRDCSLKLHKLVDQINIYTMQRYSPELGNIVFASAKFGIVFTIEQFVHYYYAHNVGSDTDKFVERMWGEVYFNAGKFSKNPNAKKEVTFVQFMLNPLYKLISHTLSQSPTDLKSMLKKEFKVDLYSSFYNLDPLPLLRHILKLVFRDSVSLLDSIVKYGATSEIKSSTIIPSSSTYTVAHVLKLMDYGGELWSLVRVYSGILKKGDLVKLINESQDSEIIDEDEVPTINVEEMGLLGGRYVVPITQASRGQIVLIKGLDNYYLGKTATLFTEYSYSFPSTKFMNEPIFKIVVEPINPSELPKLVEGLNLIHKLYPGAVVKVEESGEHVIIGTGELYLDVLMYDLRHNYANIEIKVSMPLVKFSEGCNNTSFAAIPVTSPNGLIKLSVSAEPLKRDIIRDMINGKLQSAEFDNIKVLSKKLRTEYGWDSLAARNVWNFHNCNVFIDDTLPDEVDKELVKSAKRQILQGFKWAVKEGPLAEEPIYGVSFKLLNFDITGDITNYSAQIIPLVRRACYVALLTSEPILLEPIYEASILVYEVLIPVVEELLKKRRGSRIYKTDTIVGTPLVEIKAQIPVIESIGFETDLRLATSGAGMCQMHFWNRIWRKVPGDVMDEDALIPKLKPAPINSLSRDFVMKTRRRKGLSSEGYQTNDGPTLEKYVDPDLYSKMKQNGLL
ncbi:U5 snRNP GTPase SNU114 Ecym_8104 [Eremothecium cymbalariae DBVPG|uniref:Tr-type G domain-containing protein n=1 Tax=Eremothecium cymbalariae (strain CBS 270.75 / DBVPG 7215 / KCTC 17166 / NRRL Y-17582) TaxID=931890 RepID=G8JX24_ERECY|nr:Hypothetical protein Ecym_8104 [Eremothecium cymbalariae DBVPG\